MSQRVFITGFGIITSVGKNTEENFLSLVNQRTGFGALQFLETVHAASLPACEIKFDDSALLAQAGVGEKKGYTRTTALGLIAVREAIQSAALSQHELTTSGFISATTTGGIREFERNYYPLLDPDEKGDFLQFVDTANPGEHTERIAEHLGIKRYLGTISTACSSSANAIMLGAQLIKAKKLERAICGGAEALSKFTVNGFNTLMILDHDHCKPFDANRKGLNLGEGAAYLVLESEQSLKTSGKKPIAELLGYGNANDAFHQTASSPDGAGAFRAMKQALDMAGANPNDIDYINAHGTATENNDLSEGLAIQKLFDNSPPDFSSTKPYTGHTLAAAGSIEAVFSILALDRQVIIPSLNFQQQMPELSITPQSALRENVPIKKVLSNSFGFGGNTSSLLLSKV